MNQLKLLWNLYKAKQNTKKKTAQVKALQDKKLRKLLACAYENSACYRKTFEAVGITEKNMGTVPLSALPDMQTGKKRLNVKREPIEEVS